MKFSHVLKRTYSAVVMLLLVMGGVSCKSNESISESPLPPKDALAKVGDITIRESDLEWRLDGEHPGGSDDKMRQVALDKLVQRARHVQAAIDAGLLDDPAVRDGVSRLLESRLRELELSPRIKESLKIPRERLEEIYQAEITRFSSPEKRQVAVLWLDSGVDPGKAERYAEKLNQAREFLLQSKDLLDHPEKGFSTLSVDFSEHQASRYRGGVQGWLEAEGGLDKWTKKVAKLGFAIDGTGDLSEIESGPDGVFLVRLMDIRPAVTRSFESVSDELRRSERARLRRQLEAEFESEIESANPVEWIR